MLPLLQRPEPTLASYIAGPNGEALATVRALLAGEHDGEPVYLWGETASGRSHLLQGFARAVAEGGVGVAAAPDASFSSERPLGGIAPEPERDGLRGEAASAVIDAATATVEWTPPGPVLVVDDVDRLSADAQVRLFDAINRGRSEGWKMLFAGPLPPARLTLRSELTSRLAQGLVLQLKHLSDTEKVAAMIDYAARSGFDLSAEVAEYLLRHGRRDLGTLLAMVQVIDEFSLRERRAVSVRLAHDVLHSADLFCPL